MKSEFAGSTMGSLLSNINETARFKLHIILSADKSFLNELAYLEAEGVPALNVGLSLSKEIQQLKHTDHLGDSVTKIFEDLAYSNAAAGKRGKKIIALLNFGILLERDLELNPGKLLVGLSKQLCILLLWSGQYDNDGILSWTPNKGDACVDLTSADPTVIELNYEI